MGYSVDCACGRSLAVDASRCGSTVECPCEAAVIVPSLGKLRVSAGWGAYESGPVDVILGMIRRGELPAGDRCAISGRATCDVLDVHVEAERVHSRDDSKLELILGLLVSPILLLGLMRDPRPDVGRVTNVPTPLRVAADQHARARRAGQRELKRWLRAVPAYAALLDTYRSARVVVGPMPAGD